MFDPLKQFLITAASVPFTYGEWDCAMTLANWVREQTGKDPAPHLRGTYKTEEEWKAIVEGAGGLVTLVAGLANNAGLVHIAPPAPLRRGDIGVVTAPRHGQFGAIYADPRWVGKASRGVFGGVTSRYIAWGLR